MKRRALATRSYAQAFIKANKKALNKGIKNVRSSRSQSVRKKAT